MSRTVPKTPIEIIASSGNKLHFEVVDILEKMGWKVEISPYYLDDLTDKPREIDIIATRTFRADEGSPTGYEPGRANFDVFLFIECKYFKEPIVFWMREKEKERSSQAIKSTFIDPYNKSDYPLDKMHYMNSRYKVAKLFDSVDQKNVMDAATTPIKSLTFFRDNQNIRAVYYPLVVCEGPGGFFNQDATEEKTITLEMNYSYRENHGLIHEKETFYIDFIPKDMLINFLHRLNEEIEAIRYSASIVYLRTKNIT